MSLSVARAFPTEDRFRHEALFYAGEAEFLEGTISFIREGLQAGEPILVAVAPPKVALLQQALGARAGGVMFADMTDFDRNPARLIPLWRDFVDEHSAPGRAVRGIGEPNWATRTPDELVELQRHEALLNLAFAGEAAWLLCPYDTRILGRSVLEEAEKSHPVLSRGGSSEGSPACLDPQEWAAPFDRPLSESPQSARCFQVAEAGLIEMRAAVFEQALRSGLSGTRVEDLVIAVNEVASNTIRHGGGLGTLKIWNDGASLICEVSDGSRIGKPLAGRIRPKAGQEGGFGLWLVNQLCDLVQIRTFPTGSVVRLHMECP